MAKWIKAQGEMSPAWNSNDNKEFKEGALLQGIIVEKREVVTQYGERKIFSIEQKGGKKLGLWMTAHLEALMGSLPIGTEIRVTYLGKQKTPKGQMAHRFDVEYDEESASNKLADDAEKLFNEK